MTHLSVLFVRRSRSVIFSLSARCIDPARNRSRVINSLYPSCEPALRNYYSFRLSLSSLLSSFFHRPVPFSKLRFLFVLACGTPAEFAERVGSIRKIPFGYVAHLLNGKFSRLREDVAWIFHFFCIFLFFSSVSQIYLNESTARRWQINKGQRCVERQLRVRRRLLFDAYFAWMWNPRGTERSNVFFTSHILIGWSKHERRVGR